MTSIIQSYPELLLALSCFLFFFILNISRNRPWHLPIKFPILGHIPYTILHFSNLHDWSTNVLRKCGLTFIFKAPLGNPYDILFTCDPANVNHVFNVNFRNYPKGNDFSKIFEFLGDGIFSTDEDSWKFQRRKAHALMSSAKFKSFAVEVSKGKVESSLIPLLDHFVENDEALDMQDVFLRWSFDVTCILVFGVDPGCLTIGFKPVAFASAMDHAQEAVFVRYLLPTKWWRFFKRYGLGREKKLAKAVKVLDHFVHHYINKRKEEKKENSDDLLTSYLNSEDEIIQNGFNNQEKFLRDTTINLMVAGRDTVSSALAWFFYLVSINPNVETKILEEVRSQGSTNLSNLIYLHAAFCESLRLYPPVPYEHKTAINPDKLPSGFEVDRKRKIVFSTYAMARMECIWGKDCLEFKPERWISETGKIKHEPSYKFFAFNAGPRTCLGKDLAFTQLKAVAAIVLGKFKVRVVEGLVIRPKLSIILFNEGGLMVKVSKRES